jgi:glycerol uptake facilitator-like aquaporin
LIGRSDEDGKIILKIYKTRQILQNHLNPAIFIAHSLTFAVKLVAFLLAVSFAKVEVVRASSADLKVGISLSD